MTLFNYVGYLLLGPPYGLSQAAVGLVFAAYLAGTFSSAWMGRLADRFGRPKVLRAGVAIMLAGASLTLIGNLYGVLAGIVAFVFGFFGAHSVASGLVGERARRARRRPPPCTCSFTTRDPASSGPPEGCSGNPTAGPGS